jgi:hypothetical protein
VERVLAPLASGHRFHQRRFFEEVPVCDALVDSREVLVDHPAGSHSDVADFGIAHLSRRKPDVVTGSLQ